MAKVITFGEIMLRLSTPGYLRFSQAKQFEATFGGGEANVAVSLANFGIDTEFVTRFPDNDIAAKLHPRPSLLRGRHEALRLRRRAPGNIFP